LKAASAFLRGRAGPAYVSLVSFIDAHQDRFGGVEPICRVLSEHGWQIAPSGCWAARGCRRVGSVVGVKPVAGWSGRSPLGSLLGQPVEFHQVVGGADQLPFAVHGWQTAP
jgi:hypothetical protein